MNQTCIHCNRPLEKYRHGTGGKPWSCLKCRKKRAKEKYQEKKLSPLAITCGKIYTTLYMTDQKINFNARLDISVRTLEDIPDPFDTMWSSHDVRMRDEDIKRMDAYLRRARKSIMRIQLTLNKFKSIK